MKGWSSRHGTGAEFVAAKGSKEKRPQSALALPEELEHKLDIEKRRQRERVKVINQQQIAMKEAGMFRKIAPAFLLAYAGTAR